MNINEIIKRDGYKNNTVRICEFLGFTNTEQLKNARFFSQEQSYSPNPIIGLSMPNNDYTWRLCKIVDGDTELHTVDHGYKFRLEICDGSGQGSHLYYQSDFLSLLEDGLIIYAKNENSHIEHIKWAEELIPNLFLIHEADIVVNNN